MASQRNTMDYTQAQKAARFQDLHAEAGTFIIPNPWDAGSARVLAGLGFRALARTSRAIRTRSSMI
jgi:2-methylisocitrate lyase-like PEP mutase family enzyme